MANQELIEIDLLQLFKTVLKKFWVIALVVILVAGSVFVLARIDKVTSYTASSLLYVQGGALEEDFNPSHASVRIKTYGVLLKTQDVLDQIRVLSGTNLTNVELGDMITTAVSSGSEVMKVSATAPTADQAMGLTDAATRILLEQASAIHGDAALTLLELPTSAEEITQGSNAVEKAIVAGGLAGVLAVVLFAGLGLAAQLKGRKNS